MEPLWEVEAEDHSQFLTGPRLKIYKTAAAEVGRQKLRSAPLSDSPQPLIDSDCAARTKSPADTSSPKQFSIEFTFEGGVRRGGGETAKRDGRFKIRRS